MKKQLASSNMKGFIFPYVMFIAVAIMVVITSAVPIYRNQLEMTLYLEQQLKIDTLFQMGITQFKEELIKQPHTYYNQTGQVTYYFPDGLIILTYSPSDPTTLKLNYQIQVDKARKYGFISVNYP